MIEIQVDSHDDGEALRLTQGYAAAIAQRFARLNDEQLKTKRTLVTSRFGDAATRLAQSEAKLDSFRRRNRVSANPEAELGAALMVRTGLEAQLQAKLVELDTLRQFLGPENPLLVSANP